MVELYSKILDSVEHENHDNNPYYNYNGCKYGVANEMVQNYEDEKAHQFLMGLNDDTYSLIRSQIRVLDLLPALNRTFEIVVPEENHKILMLGRKHRSENNGAFVAVFRDGVKTAVIEK